MDKKQLSERDICTKFITPALEQAGWDVTAQIREEFSLTKGRIIVRGKLHTRAKHKRADYVLFYKPNIPIAIIEAKDNNHTVGDGMQQALGYADMLQVPYIFSSNGDGFLFHNKIALDGIVERELALHEFPAAERCGNGGRSTVASTISRSRWSRRIISATAAIKVLAITSCWPSTRPSRR